jgi:hypothetical protein
VIADKIGRADFCACFDCVSDQLLSKRYWDDWDDVASERQAMPAPASELARVPAQIMCAEQPMEKNGHDRCPNLPSW